MLPKKSVKRNNVILLLVQRDLEVGGRGICVWEGRLTTQGQWVARHDLFVISHCSCHVD